MKRNTIVSILALFLLIPGCNEPETIVTNIVHRDGSVTRHVEMRSSDEIDPNIYRVPIDTTWNIENTIEVSSDGDTTWVMNAEKTFPNAEGINAEYAGGEDVNSYAVRNVLFNKRFKWFVTVYRFSEKVEKTIMGGLPLADFLEDDEMEFFSLPGSVSEELLSGPDSTIYRTLSEEIDSVMYEWLMQSLVTGFVYSATELFKAEKTDVTIIEAFKSKGAELYDSIIDNTDIESMIPVIFREEYEAGYGNVIDSTIAILSEGMDIYWSMKSYTLKTAMPGELTGSNGYHTSEGEVAWQVKPEFFLFDDHEMWAESYLWNIWAWIVSGGFVIIVLSGIIIRRSRYRQRWFGS